MNNRSLTAISLPLLLAAALSLSAGCSRNNPPQTAEQNQSATPVTPAPAGRRPNILVIVADDLGYSDLGAFGGEIDTPNLDALARAGLMLTNFHTAPMCAPTRAMLLSGMDNHLAGVGSMMPVLPDYQQGQPGYEGHLNFRVASLAELLRDAGYHTYMTGKWHLGEEEENSPAARGFERSFVLLQGGGGHFSDLGITTKTRKALYREDGKLVDLPDNFYSTRFYSERMLEYIDSSLADNRPFFAYLAYTAPHWPLQAPRTSIDKYRGRYDAGYEMLYEQRLRRMKELGLISVNAQGAPLTMGRPAWNELNTEQKRREARTMEIYAAMIDDLDNYVGHVVDYLKQHGEFDNTIILFMSDNGAEGTNLGMIPAFSDWIAECCDNSYENMGNPNSYLWLNSDWTRALVGPSRLYKTFTTEGGILAPAFIHYPGFTSRAGRYEGFVSVMDIVPTLLQIAQVPPPGNRYRERDVLPFQGSSMYAMLQGQTNEVHATDYVMGWELHGHRAIRSGNWKIVHQQQRGSNTVQWRLYNLKDDPAELNDLSEQQPQKMAELLQLWERYVAENGVILPPSDSGN